MFVSFHILTAFFSKLLGFMIPVGTSVNPGELWSCPKWGKTVILCLGTSPSPHKVYMWYTWLQWLHHSYTVPSSSAPNHATTLHPQPIGYSPSHAPFKGPMRALGLTHGYFEPITSHAQVLRQEYIYTHTPPPIAKLCSLNKLKVIQALVSDIQYLF